MQAFEVCGWGFSPSVCADAQTAPPSGGAKGRTVVALPSSDEEGVSRRLTEGEITHIPIYAGFRGLRQGLLSLSRLRRQHPHQREPRERHRYIKRKARFVPSFAIWFTLRSGYRDPGAGSAPLRDRTHRAYRTGDSDPSDSVRRRSRRNSPARSPCHRVRRPSDA